MHVFNEEILMHVFNEENLNHLLVPAILHSFEVDLF
jgi:hypothetical protein